MDLPVLLLLLLRFLPVWKQRVTGLPYFCIIEQLILKTPNPKGMLMGQ
jgi:hypothetical protein